MSLSSLLPPGLSLEQAIHLYYQVVGDTFAVNVASAAASTWIVYDILLTFADEVELVWKAKWSVPKVLYFCVRYYGLAASLLYFAVNVSPSPPFGICRGWPYFEAFGAATLVCDIFADGLFVMRLWASYERNKKVRALIAFCFIAEIATALTIGIVEARVIEILPRPPGFPIPGCYTLAKVPLTNSLAAWIINCSIATIYFSLMLYKFLTSDSVKLELSRIRNDPSTKWSDFPRFSPLFFLLLRDSVMYFAMIFCVNAVNMALSIRMEGRALEGMGVAWTFAVSTVASSRLLLNLRGLISGHDNVKTGKSKTTLQFEPPVPGESTSDIDWHDESESTAATTYLSNSSDA